MKGGEKMENIKGPLTVWCLVAVICGLTIIFYFKVNLSPSVDICCLMIITVLSFILAFSFPFVAWLTLEAIVLKISTLILRHRR